MKDHVLDSSVNTTILRDWPSPKRQTRATRRMLMFIWLEFKKNEFYKLWGY